MLNSCLVTQKNLKLTTEAKKLILNLKINDQNTKVNNKETITFIFRLETTHVRTNAQKLEKYLENL